MQLLTFSIVRAWKTLCLCT